jgi:hypothetical protein
MSLRPRYSLLTLLILTALVAGGVKLWRGPHHVVEQLKSHVTDEYTFTRDWRGNRIVQGPRILRDSNQLIDCVEVHYFRQGERLPWIYHAIVLPVELQLDIPFLAGTYHECPLNHFEKTEFDEAIAHAKPQRLETGKRLSEYEGFNFFRTLLDR